MSGRDRRRLAGAGLVVFALAAGLAVGGGPAPLWEAGGALGLAAVVFASPPAGLVLLVCGVFGLEWLAGAKYLDQALGGALLPGRCLLYSDLLVLLLGLVAARELWRGRRLRVPGVLLLCLGLVALTFVSALVNEVPAPVFVSTLRQLFKYVLVFFIVQALDLDRADLRRLVGILLCLAFFQVPLALFQRFTVAVPSGDLAGGTIGGSGALAVFNCALSALLLGRYALRPRLGYLLGACLLLVPLMVNEAKVALILVPLLYLFYGGRWFLAGRLRQRLWLALGLFGATVAAGIACTIVLYPHSKFIRRFAGLETIIAYETGLGKGDVMGRLSALRFGLELVGESPATALVGRGPGQVSSHFGGRMLGTLAAAHPYDLGRTQVAGVLIELGGLGVILFLLLGWQLYRVAAGGSTGGGDFFRQSLTEGLKGFLLVMLVSTFYTNVFIRNDQLSLAFWLLAGVSVRLRRDPELAPPAPAADRPGGRLELLGCPVDALGFEQVLDRLEGAIAARRSLRIAMLNVAKLVQARRDPELRAALAAADLVSPDGVPLLWAARLLGTPLPGRVAGIDLMHGLIARAAARGYRVFFLGAREEVNERAVAEFQRRHPGLVVAGRRHGYWAPAEEESVVRLIREARPDILLVGISSPKKEFFLDRHQAALNVPVVHGVGGSFDVVAGKVRRAPGWMQRAGLEWLFRLGQEPRRMWRRYLVTNTAFLFILAGAWLRGGRRR